MAQRSLRDSPRSQPDLNGTEHTVHPRQLLPAWLYLLHPCSRARSPLIRLATRRFEIAKRSAIDCVLNYVPMFQAKSSREWVVLVSHLFAERRVPPGAIFREKIESRRYRMYHRRGPDQAGS